MELAYPVDTGNPQQSVARPVTSHHNLRYDDSKDNLIAWDPNQITSPGNFSNPKPGDPCHAIPATSTPPHIAGTVSAEWAKHSGGPAGDESQNLVAGTIDAAFATKYGQDNQHIDGGASLFIYGENMIVRRITPLEAERLQGFPDYYTDTVFQVTKRKIGSDSARYKAIGNSMAVNVMNWIGFRINLYEELLRDGKIPKESS